MAYTGQLYQLFSKQKRDVNSYFPIDGPWDTHGRVVSSTEDESGQFLNLVRGVKTKETRLATIGEPK